MPLQRRSDRQPSQPNRAQGALDAAGDLVDRGLGWIRDRMGGGDREQGPDVGEEGGGGGGLLANLGQQNVDLSSYEWMIGLLERHGASRADVLDRAKRQGKASIDAAFIAGPNRPVGDEGSLPAADLGEHEGRANNNRAYQLDYSRSSAGIRPEQPESMEGPARGKPLDEVFQAHWQENWDADFGGLSLEQVRGVLGVADLLGLQGPAGGIRAAMFRVNQYALVSTLNVESSARYQPGGGNTYCNIYAYDVVSALGAYIPRVWWNAPTLKRIQAGAQVVTGEEYQRRQAAGEPVRDLVTPMYGTTVHEMNANALVQWMQTHGGEFGWTRAGSMTEAQEAANGGKVAVVLATGKGQSGHITVVMAEKGEHAASRNENGEVRNPLQSQAGAVNENVGNMERGSDQWWDNAAHKDGNAWIFTGTPSSELVPRELMGL